jgi:hypothetical protein
MLSYQVTVSVGEILFGFWAIGVIQRVIFVKGFLESIYGQHMKTALARLRDKQGEKSATIVLSICMIIVSVGIFAWPVLHVMGLYSKLRSSYATRNTR